METALGIALQTCKWFSVQRIAFSECGERIRNEAVLLTSLLNQSSEWWCCLASTRSHQNAVPMHQIKQQFHFCSFLPLVYDADSSSVLHLGLTDEALHHSQGVENSLWFTLCGSPCGVLRMSGVGSTLGKSW